MTRDRSPLHTSTLPGVGALPAPPGAEIPSTATDPFIGTPVGSFRIVKRIGMGGMGVVYLAEHPVIRSRVAVKMLHDTVAGDHEAVTRFFGEARVTNLIGHPGIVSIIDLNVIPPGRYYIVMEYLEGPTLAAFLEQGLVAQDLALGVLVQLCETLQAAHARGIVHRDVKPDNVFLLPRKRVPLVKLVDFGIAKLRETAAKGITAPGSIMGTPRYMSPEQSRGKPVDERTDVYALGVIAYELATGKAPFEETSLPELMMAHLMRAPVDPRTLRPELDEGFGAAILKALEKDPAQRFANAGELGNAFAHALGRVPRVEVSGELSLVEIPRVVTRPTTPAPAANDDETSPADDARNSLPTRVAWIAGGVAAVLLGGWMGFGPAREAPAGAKAAASAGKAPVVEVIPPPAAPAEVEKPVAPPSPKRAAPKAAETNRDTVATEKVRAEEKPSSDHKAPGLLTLQSRPWAAVFIDGQATGKFTPVADLQIAPGRHQITLVNEKVAKRAKFTVDVKPGQRITESHELR